MRVRAGAAALLGLAFATSATVAAYGTTATGGTVTDPEPRATASTLVAGAGGDCAILTDRELDAVFGRPASLTEASLPGGRWCSWMAPWGLDTIIALQLITEQGEERFDEARERAERGEGPHETEPGLGPLSLTSHDGRTTTVAWVVDGRSRVLSLTAGHLTADDLVVLAKAVDARLRSRARGLPS